MKAAWARISLLTGASLVAIARGRGERSPDGFEFGMLHGLRSRGLL